MIQPGTDVTQEREVVIRATDLSKRYRIYHNKRRTLKEALMRGRGEFEEFSALDDVSFEVRQGETVGVLGSNGSGKSTLLKLVARILQPDSGSLEVNGNVSALLEVGAGFHPEYTGRENIYLYGALLGLSRPEVNDRYQEIIEFSGLQRFIDNPVKNYSSGQFMRLGFSVAIHVHPQILLIDEVLAVGDAAFQRRCLERIADLRAAGTTILFVSHDLGTMRELCQRAIWMDRGRMILDGPVEQAVGLYLESSETSDTSSAPAVPAEAKTRWGTGEALITDLAVRGPAGDIVPNLVHGKPASLDVTIECREDIEEVAVGVGFFKRDGTYCTGVNMAMDERSTALPAGQHTVRLELPRVDLIQGSYLLDVAAFRPSDGHIFDFHSRTHALRVSGTADGEGIYVVDHAWSVDPAR